MSRLVDLVDTYVTEKAARGHFNGHTPRTATYTLRTFVRDALDADGTITTQAIETWLMTAKLAPATTKSRLSLIRGYCRWLVRRGELAADPTIDIDGPRMPRYVPRGLRPDAVGATLTAAPDTRGRLIVFLMCQEGLRCCEVGALELADLDFETRVMLINGKGGHQRVLPVSDETWETVLDYLHEHPAAAGPLIRSYLNPHQGIHPAYISTLVARWMRQAGVKQRPRDGRSAHALRHTAATDMLRAGAHLRDVQQALGHASLSTTQKYLPWVVGDLRTAMAGRKYGRAARNLTEASD